MGSYLSLGLGSQAIFLGMRTVCLQTENYQEALFGPNLCSAIELPMGPMKETFVLHQMMMIVPSGSFVSATISCNIFSKKQISFWSSLKEISEVMRHLSFMLKFRLPCRPLPDGEIDRRSMHHHSSEGDHDFSCHPPSKWIASLSR